MVDPLSLRVFANLFASVAEEMGVTLQRASYSQNIKLRRDYSCAVFDAAGRLLAQAAHIPVHLGAMPLAMAEVLERYSLQPADVVILNDPFAGGTHLPDISLVSPVYLDGALLGYVMSRAHHSDVGGMSPGSMPLSTELYQEGVIIPPLLLFSGGRRNDELWTLLLANVRTPDERAGDIAAQLAAQRTGEQRLVELALRHGPESLAEHGAALQEYSERALRGLIASIPAGEYCFEDALDDDGQNDEPVLIRVTVRRPEADATLEIDFSSSAPQQRGPINTVIAVTTAATLYVLRCLLAEDTPVNHGMLAPLRIIAPPGTVVSAQPPAAVAAGNVETSQRITDVVFGALAACLPATVPAASQGTMNNLTLGGYDRFRATPFAYYETMGGGMGARPACRGGSAMHDHMSNTLNTPVEALESSFPVRVRRYAIRRDSGGAGRFRGGEGLCRELEFLVAVDVTILSERRRLAPYGLAGGRPGQPGSNTLARGDGATMDLPGKVRFRAEAGDVLTMCTPGGGGHGALRIDNARW